MKTMTRKAFLALCAKLGAIARDDGESVCVDAPQGKVFVSSENHWHTISRNDGAWKVGEIYAELADRMGDSVEDCAEAGCEACGENIAEEGMVQMYGPKMV